MSKFIWEVGLGEFYTRPVSLHEAPSLVAVCGQRAVGASVVDQDNATLSVKGVWGNVAQHSERSRGAVPQPAPPAARGQVAPPWRCPPGQVWHRPCNTPVGASSLDAMALVTWLPDMAAEQAPWYNPPKKAPTTSRAIRVSSHLACPLAGQTK